MAQLTLPVAMVIASSVAAVGAGAAAVLSKPSAPKLPTALPPPTRTAAITAALNSDSTFRHRQGAAATMLTGPNGAEAPSPGAKALLGQ